MVTDQQHLICPILEEEYLWVSHGSASPVIGTLVGNAGGSETHLIAPSEMSPHSHGLTSNVGVSNASSNKPLGTNQAFTSTTVTTTVVPALGTQTSMTIVQPLAIVNKIIKT